MPEEPDAEEIMSLALMPVGARKHLLDGGNLRVVAGDAGAHDDPQRLGRVKVIIDHFHLPLGHPIHTGNGVQGQALFIELLGGEHNLVRCHGRLSMIAFGRVIDAAKRQAEMREGIGQGGRRLRRSGSSRRLTGH